MRKSTLTLLKCPDCDSALACADERDEIGTGSVGCTGCKKQFPVLAGVLVLVSDVRGYLLEHAKGIARYVDDSEIPKKFRAEFLEVKRELEVEHIEEDLEAERVTALYLMTHYLGAKDVSSPDPLLNELIQKHWNNGPFARIKNMLASSAQKHRSFIELGCGVGGLCLALEGEIGSYLGVDSSFASIALARHYALGAPLKQPRTLVPHDLLQGAVSREIKIVPPQTRPNADFVVCDLSAPPVKTGHWDVSAALNVIDMLPEPRDLPKLQHALLAKGGLAIQSCPYIWHPEVAARLRKTLPKNVTDSVAAAEHIYKERGFTIEASEPHVPWLFFKNTRQLEIYSVHLFSASRA